MDGLQWEIRLTWMIWGFPHFRKPLDGLEWNLVHNWRKHLPCSSPEYWVVAPRHHSLWKDSGIAELQNCYCSKLSDFSVVCWWLLRSLGTRLSRSWRSFANTKASTRQRPCRRQPVGICSARSHAEDLYQVFRMSPGHQRMWRSSEAWLRSQPGVAARVSPHEAWDFLRTVLAADPEDAQMEGFFGCWAVFGGEMHGGASLFFDATHILIFHFLYLFTIYRCSMLVCCFGMAIFFGKSTRLFSREDRPTAQKALQHPWLVRHQPDAVPIAQAVTQLGVPSGKLT